MRFLNPAGWFALLGLIPVVALHILRPRRASEVVSSTFLWEQIETPVTATKPIQRLRPSWLLLLQLLAVILAAVALANPARVEPSEYADHTVFLVDASGSMAALDGAPDRLATGREAAIRLRADLPDGSLASLVEIGPRARVLISASADPADFEAATERIGTSAGTGDFEGAFDLARGLETADASIGFVLISDGQLSSDAQRRIPDGTRFEAVGSDATNRGIIDLIAEPVDEGLHVIATVANTGGPAATQTLRLDVDGRTRERVELQLPSGETITHETTLGPGDEIEAFLEGEDLLAADNRRSAVTSQRSAVDVQIISGDDPDPFVTAALSSLDGVSIIGADNTPTTAPPDDTAQPEQPDDAADTTPSNAPATTIDPEADLVVFDGVDVPTDIDTPFLAIAPPTGLPDEVGGIQVTGSTEQPVASLIRSDDALMQGLDLTELGIASSQTVNGDTADVLMAAEDAPLLMRGRTDVGVPFLYLSFSPAQSNLPVLVAFPMFTDRYVTELTGAAVPPTDVEVGDELTVPGFDGGYVVDPIGNRTEVAPGRAAVVTDRPGVWSVSNGRTVNPVAVNPAAQESTVAPVDVLPIAKKTPGEGEQAPERITTLRPWIIGALALVLIGEFLLSRRRVGVSARQWRLSNVARGVVAVALLLGAIGVGIPRTSSGVATIFVVDLSDSMGSDGENQAVSFIVDALDEMPAGDRAAVVGVGGDARIENLLSEEVAFSRPSTVVDSSATNLAGGLRLGAALLPSDSRRRIVLVSDGRATSGNVVDEAARLSESGIAIDTVTVDAPGAADIAIGSISAPQQVDEGQTIELDVAVEASIGGRATVRLRRDDEIVGTQTVDVTPGTNVVTFTDTADGSGAQRYSAEVTSDRDAVGQNNTVYSAVAVNGVPKVLVVEGTGGAGDNLTAALQAGSIDAEVIDVESLPTVDRLMEYSSIVLVDVDERLLTEVQVGSLIGAVRDGGRGLVTLGGDQSYGLGGYYESELETLLPVISEILDPKRRKSVAEVLAIDTSGSMGACHCAEGQLASNRLDGGVVKTDIARAAASRTISALSDNDEIGVLGFDIQARWIVDLQKLPPQTVVAAGLSTIRPSGSTNPSSTLEAAAAKLRTSNASLKHIVLFTDGFTSPGILGDMALEAADLADEGITVSVIGTGEGAADALKDIADAGNGRYYPGRDLQRIPEIIMEESVIASRDFIQEGTFTPVVRSARPVVADLDETPPLLGYLATTAKPTATQLLTVGPEDDPLLTTWTAGLGTVTSWTSDASDRWSQGWATWDGYVGFWSDVVRDTFPAESSGTTATIEDGLLTIRVEAEDAFADGSTASATVSDPSLGRVEIPLTRVEGDAFAAQIPADQVGTYVIGTSVVGPDGGDATVGSATANLSYSAEYIPGPTDAETMKQVARRGNGRVDIDPTAAFDGEGLSAARSYLDVTTWWLLVATIAMLAAMVLSRLNLSSARATVPGQIAPTRRTAAVLQRVRAIGAGVRRRATTPTQPTGKPVGQPEDKPTATSTGTTTTQPEPSIEARKRAVAADTDRRDETERQKAESATLDALLERRRSRSK